MKSSKFVNIDENILIEYIYDDGDLVGESYNIVKNAKSGINSFVSATPTEYSLSREVLIDNLARENVENTTNIIENQLFLVDQQQSIYGKFNREKYSFLQYREYPISIPIRYDTIKIHIPINYTFAGYLGFYIRIYTLDYTEEKFVELSNYHFNVTDINQSYNMEYSSPSFIFKERSFGKYLKVKIPSITKVSDQRVKGAIKENTINWNLTDGVGLSKNSPVFIDFQFIQNIQYINSYPYFDLSPKKTVGFPQTPEFEKVGVVIEPSNQGDFYLVYGTFNGSLGEFNQFMNDSVYYNNKYYCEYTIDLYEKNILVKSQKVVVTEDFIEEIEYRPIIKFSTTTAIIDVTLKIIDNSDFSEIVRKASYAITNEEVSKYSLNLTKIDLSKADRTQVFNIKSVINTNFDGAFSVKPQLSIEKMNFTVFSNQFFIVNDTVNAFYQNRTWLSQNGVLINLYPFDNVIKFNFIDLDDIVEYRPFDFSIFDRLQLTIRSDKNTINFPIYRESSDNDLENGSVVFKISEDKYQQIKKVELEGFNLFYINGILGNDSKIVYSGIFQSFDSDKNILKLNNDFETSQSKVSVLNVSKSVKLNKKVIEVESKLKDQKASPKSVVTNPEKNKVTEVKNRNTNENVSSSELTVNKSLSVDVPKLVTKEERIMELKKKLQIFWNPIYSVDPKMIVRQRNSENKGFKIPNNLFKFKIILVSFGYLNNSMNEKLKTDLTNALLGYFKGLNLNPVSEELNFAFTNNKRVSDDIDRFKNSVMSNKVVQTWWGWNGRGKSYTDISVGELSSLSKESFDIIQQIYVEYKLDEKGNTLPPSDGDYLSGSGVTPALLPGE